MRRTILSLLAVFALTFAFTLTADVPEAPLPDVEAPAVDVEAPLAEQAPANDDAEAGESTESLEAELGLNDAENMSCQQCYDCWDDCLASGGGPCESFCTFVCNNC